MKKPKRVEKKEAPQKRALVKAERLLTRAEFLGLAEVPAALSRKPFAERYLVYPSDVGRCGSEAQKSGRLPLF